MRTGRKSSSTSSAGARTSSSGSPGCASTPSPAAGCWPSSAGTAAGAGRTSTRCSSDWSSRPLRTAGRRPAGGPPHRSAALRGSPWAIALTRWCVHGRVCVCVNTAVCVRGGFACRYIFDGVGVDVRATLGAAPAFPEVKVEAALNGVNVRWTKGARRRRDSCRGYAQQSRNSMRHPRPNKVATCMQRATWRLLTPPGGHTHRAAHRHPRPGRGLLNAQAGPGASNASPSSRVEWPFAIASH